MGGEGRFLDKNSERLNAELPDMLNCSEEAFIAQLFAADENAPASEADSNRSSDGAEGGKRPGTRGVQLRKKTQEPAPARGAGRVQVRARRAKNYGAAP